MLGSSERMERVSSSSSSSLLASPRFPGVCVGHMVRSVFRTGAVVALAPCDVYHCESLLMDIAGSTNGDILDANGNLNENLFGLQTLLGRGGFGAVYGGQVGSQKVAVKCFHPQSVNNDAKVASFNAEVNSRQLVHPNIVRVFSSNHCLDTQNMYIVMELAGLHNLQFLLDDSTEPLGIRRHLRYLVDIAEALLFVHHQHLVHLDVKPTNIIITPSDHCKLGDFGCSQYLVYAETGSRAVSPTGRASLTGTYAYRAPELLRGEAPTAKADIFSFGVTQWQMMSRRRPYENQHQHCVIFGVVAYNVRPEQPGEVEETDMVSSCFRELYWQCWRADPGERPSAADLVDVFTTWSGVI